MRQPVPLMIFAAGFGTRMGALTRERPKPLIEVGGQSLIARAIDRAEAAGTAPIAANTHYLADQLQPVLEGRRVRVSREDGQILDTGGGLKRALPLLPGGIVATHNPDVIFSGPNPISLLLDAGLPDEADALLLVVPIERARARKGGGDFYRTPDARLSRGGDLVYTGTQLIRTGPVADYPEEVFSLNALWTNFAEAGRLLGLVYPGAWCDIGHPDGIAEAERMLAEARHG